MMKMSLLCYQNNKERIIKAQAGDEKELEKLVEENKRINMECCKKI